MAKYLYETHLHTCQASACGKSLGRDYVRKYLDMGYSGIFVTDHFFQGNCAIPRNKPWRERVEMYMSGYYDAKYEGDRLGLPVFFGLEQNYAGDEYLIYGIDEKFLLNNPEIETWKRPVLAEKVRSYGGCIIQAHPFRERLYLSRITLSPEYVDGIEAVNMGNGCAEDIRAYTYARHLNLPMTAGSDNHDADKTNEQTVCATVLSEKLACGRDYASAILSRKGVSMKFPEGRLSADVDMSPTLPVNILNASGEVIGHDPHKWLKPVDAYAEGI